MSQQKPSVTPYRVELFDMTRTVNSWIQGFPARLDQAQRELGTAKCVAAAHRQFEKVLHHQSNPTGDSRKTRTLIFAASKLNDMLIKIEGYMRERREREGEGEWESYRWHYPNCPGENGMAVCTCFD